MLPAGYLFGVIILKLETDNHFYQALRADAPVIVFIIDPIGEKHLDGYGSLIEVTKDSITILDHRIGVVNYLRENIEVYWVC